ncbi:MAG: 6-carboxytetrahydropterin synthase [Pseudomonadota bacterium]
MSRLTTIHIRNQYLKFSAGHFTIFSATERERLHGHNFAATADVTAPVGDDGLCFDYNIVKKALRRLCDSLDEYVLIAGRSSHLTVTERSGEYQINFAEETLKLPVTDTLILPLANITAEELSWWLATRLLEDDTIQNHDIRALTVTISSGYGQAGSTQWTIEGGFA